jgi:hypothetical protein
LRVTESGMKKGYVSVLRFLNPPFRPLTTGFYPVGDSITARTYSAAVVTFVGGC